MKYRFILSLFFLSYLLNAQEKKELNDNESYLLKVVVSPDSTTIKWDNRDSLRIDKENYIFLKSPVDILDGSKDILYRKKQGFSPGLSFRKRYFINFELIDSFLYITNYHLAPDYTPNNKGDTNLTKSLEQLLGRKINKEQRLKVDWLRKEYCYDHTITLYVTDKANRVYSLDFKQGKLVRKTFRKDIRVKTQSLPRLEDLKVKE